MNTLKVDNEAIATAALPAVDDASFGHAGALCDTCNVELVFYKARPNVNGRPPRRDVLCLCCNQKFVQLLATV
jgi:hypothetical protein